ncbi:deoxyribonuclease IV [bacterium]|nr:deoxyribonuclease IV [bacterium]
MNIGAHLSVAKGFALMGETAVSIGANTFQFFSRNPRGSKSVEIEKKDVDELIKIMNKNKFAAILAHAPYTINACSDKQNVRDFAKIMFREDLEKLEKLPCKLYVFHPGNHMKQGEEVAIQYLIDALNDVLNPEYTTMFLLETMSGKGTEIGKTFKELKKIINGVKLKEKIGVCLDTCHVYSAGYDIVNNLNKVIDEFDSIIGLNRLKAVHLNDSLTEFASHKDRHACIGKGYIGLDAMRKVIMHPKLKKLPFFLETPTDLKGYAKEIELLTKF